MSKFVVSARKYRPATFDEVVGQNHVAKTLKNALQTDQLAHAFLFCGPRGVGKTTCARILAKVINCENPKDQVEPCNDCSSCKSFNDNASFNIIELDAASNNSVEHIRTLIEQVRFQPQHGTHKVFIIDEVHMLSSQAFNAFLKTLEEPPPYAIFILATTEKHKIIPTILSRCQIFDFKRIQVQDAVLQLENICKQEGKKAEPEALHLIAQKADGAMRDALSIFDKIASATGDTITYKDVITNLNILDYDYYFKVVDAFLREDLSDVFLYMDEISRAGFEPEQFVQGLAEHMRDLLVCKDARTLKLLDVSDTLKTRYQHQAALTSKSVLLTGLDILNQCDVTLPRSKNKRLYTEIALSKINFANRAIETNLVGAPTSEEKKTKVVSKPPPSQSTAIPQAPNPKSIPVPEEKVAVEPEKIPSSSPAESSSAPEETPENTEPTNIEVSPVAAPTAESEIQEAKEVSSVPVTEKIPPPAPKEKTNSADLDSMKSGLAVQGVDAILAAVHQEEADLKEAQKGFNLDTIQRLWDKYAKGHSLQSTKAMLDKAIIQLQDKDITVILPSKHYKTMLQEEDALIEMLRVQLGSPSLTLNSVVDRAAFPDMEEEKPKVLLTAKEKYKIMAEDNPLVASLVQGLDLKPDTTRR